LIFDFPYWFIKILDFPRIQYFFVGVVLLILFGFMNKKWTTFSVLLVLGILSSLVIHGTRLLPYVAGEKTVPDANFEENLEEKPIGILLANVLIGNKEAPKLIEIIKEANPDLILVMEVNEWWISELQGIRKNYPYFIEHPLDNAYGIALYSKFKFKDQEIKFFNDDKVPSIHTKLLMPSGKEIQFHGMHPVPAVPSSKYPDNVGKKEIALIKVGTMVANNSLPSIVAGDFNDVSWSQTTRMFESEGDLNDVRIGRGFYNSFDAKLFFLRWPLDHYFVTKEFSLVTLKRLPEFGSDHFPMFAEFVLSD
jgi:endonuclease/exonuclease/phosphatase (EEP) superfamily protein YafD